MSTHPDASLAADAPQREEPGSVLAQTLRVPLLWKLVLSNVALLSLVGLAVAVLENDPGFTGRARLFVLLAVACAGVVSFAMVHLALRPLAALERTAERVEAGDADARVPASMLADPDLDRLGHTVNGMLDALAQARERQRELSLRALRFQERDRGRLAGDLHDRTAQTLAGVLLELRLLDRAALSPPCLESIGLVREHVRGALEEVRAVARDLRPPELDELGTRSALDAYARGLYESGGPHVRFVGALPERRLSEDARLALFRVVQEALKNVHRHAGTAQATVRFHTRDDELVVEVGDEGVGFDPELAEDGDAGRLGLATMAERAGYADGRVTVESAPGTGTRVRLHLPLGGNLDGLGRSGLAPPLDPPPVPDRDHPNTRREPIMFDKLLVTLDGSAFSEWALLYAAGISRRTGAAVELASVHEAVTGFAYEEWESAALEWTEEYLARIQTRLSEDLSVPVGAWVGSGPVVDAILARAEAVDADLLVCATHGRGAITRAWLGSVADGLLRHTDRPLLVIRPEKGETPPENPTFRRILVPLDGSEFSESILGMAKGVARAFQAEIHLMRVVAYPVEIASPYLPHTVQMNQAVVDEARDAARTELEKVAADLQAEGLTVKTHVLVDSQAGHAICAECRDLGVDLVVMATHGRGGLKRTLLGSTADKVIRSAHTPVLVRRPPDMD